MSGPLAERAGSRAVAYVRVSMEREDMISPELQATAIHDYCKRRGYTVVAVIEDLDLSGRFWKRRQVEQGIAMIEAGDADVLVVWRWSRVSRNRLDWAIAVDRVESVGGTLESATEGFDTTTATGRFARGMLAEFAAYESDRMGDIWREIKARRLRIGLTPEGRQQFGYRKVKGLYVINKRTGPVLADLYRRYNAGESFGELARWLQAERVPWVHPRRPETHWASQTLAALMDRGFAAGLIRYQGQMHPGAHKPVITAQEWGTYLTQRAGRRRAPRHYDQHTYLLHGLAYCVCGKLMVTATDEHRRYKCVGHDGQRHLYRTINESRLHDLLHRWLTRLAHDPDHAAAARQDSRRHADQQAAQARDLARQLSHTDSLQLHQAWTKAETTARWRDPVEIAHTLLEDWGTLTHPITRARLSQLADRFSIHTDQNAPTLTVHTTWGAASPITLTAGEPPPLARRWPG